MLTINDINEAKETLTFIMKDYKDISEASSAFIKFIADMPGDDHLEYMGKLLKGRSRVVEIGGGNPSSLLTDIFAQITINEYNNEVMEQIDALFYIACVRQQLPLPTDMRADVVLLLDFMQNNLDYVKESSDKYVGLFFYGLVKRMMDPTDPNNN